MTADDARTFPQVAARHAHQLAPGREHACPVGCESGACETCPCCSAGWCVFGLDGLPEDADDLALWSEIAAEHNPLVAELRAHQAAVQAVRELADDLATPGGPVSEWIAARIRAAVAALDPKEQDR